MATIIGNWVAKGIPYVGNNWVPLPNMPAVRNSMAAFVSAGNVYLLGGSPNTGTTAGSTLNPQPFWRYNTASPGSYTVFASLTTPSARLGAWAVGGSQPLVGGGFNVGTNLTDMFQYNVGTNTWTALASLPVQPVIAATAHEIGANVHVLGSWNTAGTFSGRNLRYDRLSNSWTNLSPPALDSRGGNATIYDGKIIFMSGSAIPVATEYNPATNTSATLATKPGTGRNFFAGGGDNTGAYFVIGGGGPSRTATNVTDEVYRYSRPTNSWSGPLNPLPTPRFLMASVVIGTRLYCFGGHTPGTGTIQLADAYDM